MSPQHIPYSRCLLCAEKLPVLDGRPKHCLRCKRTKCAGCGHALSKHTHYADGRRNRHGSTLVCSVDNCAWTECRDAVTALRAAGDEKETRE